jgi:hypothetical protein
MRELAQFLYALRTFPFREVDVSRIAGKVAISAALLAADRGFELDLKTLRPPLEEVLERQHRRLARDTREQLESLGTGDPDRVRQLRKQLSRGAVQLPFEELAPLAERLVDALIRLAPPGFLSVQQLRDFPADVAGLLEELLGDR